LTTNQIEERHTTIDASTRLAVERTRLAYERTLMAWVRTAISLITFGFTIYKFFQLERDVGFRRHGVIGPTEFAMLMIIIGLLSLLMATVEHRRDLRALKAQYPDIPRSLARLLAALISILGILALVAVILRR
jgi:putative membrane protein